MKKSIAAILAATTLSLANVGAASAAVGTLPSTDQLYTLDCSSAGDGNLDHQLYAVDAVTGEMTEIGNGTNTDIGGCGSNVALDPTTGKYWTFNWDDVDPNTGGYQYGLLTVDIVTGEVTEEAATSLGGNFGWGDNYAIAIDADGNAFAIGRNSVYSIDLSTGVVVEVWNTEIANDEGGGSPYGAAFNPADGLLYVQYDGTREMWALDLDSESYTFVARFPSGDEWYGPFGFDSEGNIWQQNNYQLFTYSLDDVTALTNMAEFTLDGGSYYTESLFIGDAIATPNPELAETGFDATPWMVVTAGILLAGAALARCRSIR